MAAVVCTREGDITMTITLVAVAALIVIYADVLFWCREHGEDGHKHRWDYGATPVSHYVYRTCQVCGHREYEITG